jgi:hypothetical protein
MESADRVPSVLLGIKATVSGGHKLFDVESKVPSS